MFLSYLDLDMAFDDATFVDCWGVSGAKGLPPHPPIPPHTPTQTLRCSTLLPRLAMKHSPKRGGCEGRVGIAPESFSQLLRREHVNFMEAYGPFPKPRTSPTPYLGAAMEVLAGSDANNGVPQVAMHVVEAHREAP